MIEKKPKIGVIGAGHLGKHHIKQLSQHKSVEFVGAFDTNKNVLKEVCAEFSVKMIDSMEDFIGKCTAVHIVTPTNTHFAIAKFFLENNVDILIEKLSFLLFFTAPSARSLIIFISSIS